MKLFNIKDVKGFFKTVEHCEGRVELITNEGDRLNLKSTLSQYVSLAELFSSGNKIPELEVVCSEKSDYEKLLNFMMNEENDLDFSK